MNCQREIVPFNHAVQSDNLNSVSVLWKRLLRIESSLALPSIGHNVYRHKKKKNLKNTEDDSKKKRGKMIQINTQPPYMHNTMGCFLDAL